MSCAVTTSEPTQILFDRYTEYNLVVNEENLKEKYFFYIDESLVDEEYIEDPDSVNWLIFNNWIVQILIKFLSIK